MKIWTFILQLWTLLQPYITAGNIAQIEAAIEQAIKDYTGGNLAGVVQDLVALLKAILPAEVAPKLDALVKGVE